MCFWALSYNTRRGPYQPPARATPLVIYRIDVAFFVVCVQLSGPTQVSRNLEPMFQNKQFRFFF